MGWRVSELERAQPGDRDRVHLPRPVWDELVPSTHELRAAVVGSLRRSGGVPRTVARRLFAGNPDPRLGHALGYLFERVAVSCVLPFTSSRSAWRVAG